jgi:hypothetical protein
LAYETRKRGGGSDFTNPVSSHYILISKNKAQVNKIIPGFLEIFSEKKKSK